MTIKCLGCGHYVTLHAPLGRRGKFGRCECDNRTDLVPVGSVEVCRAVDFSKVLCWHAPEQEVVPVESLVFVKREAI